MSFVERVQTHLNRPIKNQHKYVNVTSTVTDRANGNIRRI